MKKIDILESDQKIHRRLKPGEINKYESFVKGVSTFKELTEVLRPLLELEERGEIAVNDNQTIRLTADDDEVPNDDGYRPDLMIEYEEAKSLVEFFNKNIHKLFK